MLPETSGFSALNGSEKGPERLDSQPLTRSCAGPASCERAWLALGWGCADQAVELGALEVLAGVLAVVAGCLVTWSRHVAPGKLENRKDVALGWFSPGFLAQEPVLQSRRSLFAGITAMIAGSASLAGPAGARIVELGLPCACCERDWCATACVDGSSGEVTQCNCHEFLGELASANRPVVSGGLYKIPVDATKARLDAMDAGLGEQGWVSKLGWKEANLLKWNPEDFERRNPYD